jgi:hypothetical protein
MEGTTMQNKAKNLNEKKNGELVDVLYQRIGDRWYAFSLIDDEVFFGTLTEEQIRAGAQNGEGDITDPIDNSLTPKRRRRGNA